MKISNSKKELARIISENGGWREVAEWAAQDSKIDQFPFRVCFYQNRPTIEKGDTRWIDGNCRPIVDSVDASSQIENWHQTILSRDEYFHLYPAPDIDMHGDSTITIGGDQMTAMRRMQDSVVFDTTPTIEQLAADYRNAKDYALRLQEEANNAWNAAEKAKVELIDAGKSIGIDIQPITAKQ